MQIKSLVLVFVSVLLMSCGQHQEGSVDTQVNYISDAKFNAFKAAVMEKVEQNHSLIQGEKVQGAEHDQKVLSQVSQLKDEISTLTQQHAQYDTEISALEEQFKQLSKQHDAISEELKSKLSQAKKTVKKKTTSPQFKAALIGIVQWGQQHIVHVAYKGKELSLRSNEVVDGWRLAKVDTPMKHVTFTHDKTQKSIVKVLP